MIINPNIFKTVKLPIYISTFVLIVLTVAYSGCREEIFYKEPDAKLMFSNDTVLFDTIFTTIGSVTKRFLIFNPYNQSLKISTIRLAGGKTSPYRINIDGEAVEELKNHLLLPNDSMYIFVDVTIDPNTANLPFIVKDSIEFVTNGNKQYVKLMAWGQNAHFIHDSMLACNSVWTNDLPYVISNHVGIDKNCKLTIEPGVKIYSDEGSAFLVWGTLEVKGDTNNKVEFSSIRQDQYYKNIPGQWYGIYFIRESKDNYIKNATIRNAIFGIRVDSLPVNNNPNLILENVRIENMSVSGFLGYTAVVYAYNCIFDNSCEYLAAGNYGGDYRFYHCSFSHETCRCSSKYPALAFYNDDNKTYKNKLKVTLINSIVNGPKEEELEIKKTGSDSAIVFFSNCLLKTKQTAFNINGNILNKNPDFIGNCNYNFNLDSNSVCIDKGNASILDQIPVLKFDIDGKIRNDLKPDLGALERKK